MSWPARDTSASAGSIVLFSFGLGVSNLAIPLAALSAGYDAAAIGVLTAVSAVTQLLVRMTLPFLSRHFADRALVSLSSALLAASCAVLVASTAPVPFTIAQLLQGGARGYFWSGSQLHGVRTSDSTLKAIARVNLFSSPGLLLGPLAAGALVSVSPQRALAVAALVAAGGAGAAALMTRLPLLKAETEAGSVRTWRRPAVLQGSIASVGAGAWSAMMTSYVPIILAGEQSSVVVGALVSVAFAAHMLGSAAIAMVRDRLSRWLAAGSLSNGLGLALIAPLAGSVPLTSAVLVLCSLGSGALLTLGPALATQAVGENERASAIAVTGGARAIALMVTPLAVAAAVTVAPLGATMAVVGALLAIPFRIRSRDA